MTNTEEIRFLKPQVVSSHMQAKAVFCFLWIWTSNTVKTSVIPQVNSKLSPPELRSDQDFFSISDGQVVIVKGRYTPIQAKFIQKELIVLLGQCLCLGRSVGHDGKGVKTVEGTCEWLFTEHS